LVFLLLLAAARHGYGFLMQAGREIGWLEFYREVGIDFGSDLPQVAYDWDALGLSPTDTDDDRLAAAANLLGPSAWEDIQRFLDGPEGVCGHSRDVMGGITFDWRQVIPELCALVVAGLRLENRYLCPWFGLPSDEVLDAVDRGFRHSDAYVGHELDGLTPADLATIAAQQGIPADFALQTSAYLSINGMRQWLQTGLGHEQIADWVPAGYGPDDAVSWNDIGVSWVAEAEGWLNTGWGPEEAANWLRVGFRSPKDAQSWAEVVPDPEVAAKLRAAGIADAKELQQWDLSLGFETIARRRAAGVQPRP
jgi:hypothetical protein